MPVFSGVLFAFPVYTLIVGTNKQMLALNQYFDTLDALFASETVQQQDRKYLATIQADFKKLQNQQKEDVIKAILDRPTPRDQLIPFMFFMYDCFEDIRFIEQILPALPEVMPPATFNNLFWNIKQRLFTSSQSSYLLENCLRQQFQLCSNAIKSFLQ